MAEYQCTALRILNMKYFDYNMVEINEEQYKVLKDSGKRFRQKGDGAGGQCRIQATPEFETQRDADEAQWKAGEPDRHLAAVRRARNNLLKQSDEFAVSDRPITQAMKNYRTALRDITTGDIEALHKEWKHRKINGFTLWPIKPKE